MCCGAVLASERMQWMKHSNQQQKPAKERERENFLTMKMFHLFLSSLHELEKLQFEAYFCWNKSSSQKMEDISVFVFSDYSQVDSVLSYMKFFPFWERRTVLLPQIFRLKTWQRDPTATEKQLRRRRLWCFGQSNHTILYQHVTRAWSLLGIANINTDQNLTVIDNKLPTDSECTPFFLTCIDPYWDFKSRLTELQVSKCLDVHFHIRHMWCLWQINSLVLNFQHTSGFLGAVRFCNLFGFQILGCTKWILTSRITSTLEDGWHPHTICYQPLIEWTKQQNKPTISDRSRWKDAGLLSGGKSEWVRWILYPCYLSKWTS